MNPNKTKIEGKYDRQEIVTVYGQDKFTLFLGFNVPQIHSDFVFGPPSLKVTSYWHLSTKPWNSDCNGKKDYVIMSTGFLSIYSQCNPTSLNIWTTDNNQLKCVCVCVTCKLSSLSKTSEVATPWSWAEVTVSFLTPVHQVLPPTGAHLLEPAISEQPEPSRDGDGHAGAERKIQERHPKQRIWCE